MRGLIRNARLGLIAVVVFLCLRTMVMLFRSPDDVGHMDNENQRDVDQVTTFNVMSSILSSFPCRSNISRPTSEQVHTRHEHWQLYDADTIRNELLIYSAFYDDRPDVGPIPVIRILGVANVDHAPFYCQIWYDALEETPYIVSAEQVKNGRGDRFGKITYGQYMYTCKLPGAIPVPTHVSMTTWKCETSTTYLPVIRSLPSPWKQEFAICVPIAFGTVAPPPLIEWMELVQLLGVSTVHIYNATLSPSLNKLFTHYQNTGLLQVHSMPPAVDAFDTRGAKLGSPASLNDCMMRNLYRYRYLIFIDFDEVIVPKANHNYSAMIKDIKRHHRLKADGMSYTFRNTYYFLDFPGDPSEQDQHPMLKYRSRLDPSGYLYAAKSFIDPRRCLSVFNHYCYIRFPSAGKHWTVDVSTTIGTSHHYRKCNLGKDKCAAMVKAGKTDDIMLRYRDRLHSLTEGVLQTIS